MIVVVWFILHTESRYCIVVLVLSFVCYTCEIARNGKPCVVALNNFVFILFPFLFLYVCLYISTHELTMNSCLLITPQVLTNL